jgi:dipeptidyl aminopeptidase/acylaminoacyl peptidase
MIAAFAAAALLAPPFAPPDCVTAHWRPRTNGSLVVVLAHARGLWEMSPRGRLIRRLTAAFPGRGDADVALSPDGRLAAYAHSGKHRHGVWVRNLRTGQAHPAFASARDGVTVDKPAWSPDGRQVAFLRGIDGRSPRGDVAAVHPDGSGLRSLGPVSLETFPAPLAWSPNGACIASQSGQIGALNIHVGAAFARAEQGYKVYGTGIPLPGGGHGDTPILATFSADGRQLLVTDAIRDGHRIYAVRMDRPAPVTQPVRGTAVDPLPAPDGKRLAYRRRDGVYVGAIGSRHERRLPHVSQAIAWWARG